MTSCSLRWCAKVSDDAWKPTPDQYELLLSQQSEEERQRIGKFLKIDDSKRSLMGRLMLQNSAAMILDKRPSEIVFGRTKGKKPYIQEKEAAKRGLNANVSHHGPWVVLGMEEKGLVGVDVSATNPPRPLKADAFFSMMSNSLTKNEWDAVRGAGTTDAKQFYAFFVFWALKEAYTKAIGIGLALPFRRLECFVPKSILCGGVRAEHPERCAGDTSIKVCLDGRTKLDWEFEVYALDAGHVMAVAVGPHDMAVDSYKAAMSALLEEETVGHKSAPRHLTAGTIRQSLIESGNDKPAELSIDICPRAGGAISGTGSLMVVTREMILPQSLAVQYQNCA
eukprot:CAMPEP_0196720480 /NCGR_PEP_ID=MMETSP1091-20130531/3267_1 /TAXON_ID=302021 /ORGANISM="Rhodomonas sp., Strain CCMP768" /LENGTH=336 /DNA_ID=CAMNT_0042061733 /DNA_START=34 /DNA_END=1044 /DNA_ORIENTATION=-